MNAIIHDYRHCNQTPILCSSTSHFQKKHIMSTNLNGKVAFINGGSCGLGAASARRLAREGATVAIGYAADLLIDGGFAA